MPQTDFCDSFERLENCPNVNMRPAQYVVLIALLVLFNNGELGIEYFLVVNILINNASKYHKRGVLKPVHNAHKQYLGKNIK